ncbi:MAG: glycosyltransferase [Actinoallomurus sp.]
MRVLLVTSHYKPGPGGAETVVFLTERLLREAGHDVVPFAVAEPDTSPTPWLRWFPPPAGAGARTEPGRRLAGIYSRSARRALESLLTQVRPDVAHVHHVHEFLTLSVLEALRDHEVPTVMTMHDYAVFSRIQVSHETSTSLRPQGTLAGQRAGRRSPRSPS